MTDLRKAAEMALEALKWHVSRTRPIEKTTEAMDALQKALAQPEQEPVAHLWECLGRWSAYLANNGTSAMLSPPSYLIHAINVATASTSKPWVSLTDEEVSNLWFRGGGREKINGYDFAKAIEAALKEKNT